MAPTLQTIIFGPCLLAGLMALIAWVVTPRFGCGDPVVARTTAAQLQVAAFCTGVEAFANDMGRLPSGSEQLNCLLTNSTGGTNWKGPYFLEIPPDPWQRRYFYRPLPTLGSNAFVIVSAGPDGRLGTADDIARTQVWHHGMSAKL